MRTLLAVVALVAAALLAGLAITITEATTGQHPTGTLTPSTTIRPHAAVGRTGSTTASGAGQRDALAAQPMPHVDPAASHPSPVSLTDPGAPILLPAPSVAGVAGVPTGFPRTPQGALAQLAAIDQTALNGGSLDTARAVISNWALPGGPTSATWSVLAAVAQLVTDTGASHGGGRLAIVLTPVMGMIKGTVGSDFVVPCVDFELDVTIAQTARGATADCQRMLWHADPSLPSGGRWMLAAGPEPATPPSVWPDTDAAVAVGYRDLRGEQ